MRSVRPVGPRPRTATAIRRARRRRGALALPVVLLVDVLAPEGARAAASYCSPSGDVCTSALKQDGVRYLELRTFSFRGEVKICATAPGRTERCVTKTLRTRTKGLYAVRTRWSRSFDRRPSGLHRVRFVVGGETLGPRLSFRVG